MTSEDIIKQMRKALKAFGSYQFEDKGPEEVMDLEPIVAHIRDLSAADARALLAAVYDDSKHGAILATSLVMSLDGENEVWFNALLESEKLAECY